MSSRLWCLRPLLVWLCLGAAVPAFAQDPGASTRVIVRLRVAATAEGQLAAADRAAQRARIRERGDRVIARLSAQEARRARRFTTIPYFAAELSAATLQRLASDPDVSAIEFDTIDSPTLAQSVPLVGAPAAWNAGYAGSGWSIAVLDTGVAKSHPFLAGKVIDEACYSNAGGTGNGISMCPGGVTASVAPGAGEPCTGFSGCDHGTHVAGIAAGRSSTLNGVGRDATVISIKVFTGFEPSGCDGIAQCMGSFVSDQILALERVYALRGTYQIAAVNMSLGGAAAFTSSASCDAQHGARKAAIDNLRSAGIATVVASGNSGFVNAISAPACISSAISVGSTTKSDEVSGFSNAAPFLSLLAPGSSITSSIPGGGFASFNGTSMAAPHVAGAWAVLKSRLPSANVDQILGALRATGQPVVDSGNGLTFPRIRVDAAVSVLAVVSPRVTLDAPLAGAQIPSGASFTVAGWAIDENAASGTGVDAIHVYAFPAGGAPTFLGVAPYGGSRPDVAGIFGARFQPSGFTLNAGPLGPGSYQIVAYAHSATTGGFDSWAVASITVTAPRSTPLAAIDAPANGATVGRSFAVSGWAIDASAASGSGVDAVHVYAFPESGSPIFLGVATYGSARSDVAAAFGSAAFTNSGFALQAGGLAPGRYTLVVFFRSTVSGTFTSIARPIVARSPGEPFMSVDAPSSGVTVGSTFHVSGWAIDRDAPSGPGVDAIHVWAFPSTGGTPIFVGVAGYGGSRSDVGQVFGAQFANSAFDLVAGDLPPGSYQLVVYARSTVTGTFNQSVAVPIVR